MPDKASAIDDYDFIGKRARQLAAYRRRECFTRANLGVYSECWCFGAGPGGSTLPCPEIQPVENDGA
jgi:hypothetical protein